MAIPLENKYQGFHNKLHAKEYAGIITLAGAQSVQKSAYHGQVNFSEHWERLPETVKLAKLLPTSKILLSGGIIKSNTSESRIALQFFTEMGIDPKRIILEENSRTTYTNASETQIIIKSLKNTAGKPWLLVTSAYHMPRAVAVFKKQNINIHPYPVDYYTRLNYSEIRLPDFGRNLRNFDHIAHEWAGLLVYYLSGKTDEFFPDIAPPSPHISPPVQNIKKASKN
jgi:uncharacterized SAM-binding protein YcdF (DUF218 family)